MFKKFLKCRFHIRFLFNPIYRFLSDTLGEYRGITEIKRDVPVIVSLTSFYERFDDLELTLYSLFNQTTLPDRIILWFSDEYSLPDIPYSVSKYIKNGLEIRFVKDIGPFTKIIYALQEFEDCVIVTADDDVYYPKNWLEKLYHSYLSSPDDIHVHRAHRVFLDTKNSFAPYEKWIKHINEEKARYDNFLTGVGGVLYPPNCFVKEVFRSDIFLKYTPDNDDIWLWFMALVSNRKIRIVKSHIKTLTVTNILRQLNIVNAKTLYSDNIKNNDMQIANLMNFYSGNVLQKIEYRGKIQL